MRATKPAPLFNAADLPAKSRLLAAPPGGAVDAEDAPAGHPFRLCWE